MSGISIISGTDRPDSRTEQVARHIQALLNELGVVNEVLSLRSLPRDLDHLGLYGGDAPEVRRLIQRHITPFDKLLFVIPEYNGSFPGMLKVLIDSAHPRDFHGKHAALVGISDGHAGNLRGLDHFQAILNYLRVDVLWLKPKLSAIDKVLNTQGEVVDERALKQLHDVIDLLRKR
ncbi:MAG: NAD(P)H-dependent oxidoreductase [Flavobacteriales bacterium]|nr:NAD(P)H-dependent oxidoreductase [Flavobacteriales bacterium]